MRRPTITASAVETKSALPRPQPARKPTSSPTEDEVPDSAAKTTTRASPASSVLRLPIRLETKPVSDDRGAGGGPDRHRLAEERGAAGPSPAAVPGGVAVRCPGGTVEGVVAGVTVVAAVAHAGFSFLPMCCVRRNG